MKVYTNTNVELKASQINNNNNNYQLGIYRAPIKKLKPLGSND